MKSIAEKQSEIVNEFKQFDSWESKYKYIIGLGKSLAPMPETHRIEKNKVKGCQSQVWLHAELNAAKQIRFTADSDALIVKGLIALLMKVYDFEKASEILKFPPQFILEIDLGTHLSPSRANGLNAMIKQIMNYAVAFEMLSKAKIQ